MKFKQWLGVAVCAASLGLSAQASADIVNVTYTGTVSNGYDISGIFGTPQDLTGQSFTANYTFDTGLGYSYSDLTYAYNYVQGGGVYPIASPNLSASITINAATYSFVGDWYAEIYGQNSPSFNFSEVYHDARADGGNTMLYTWSYDYSTYYPASITEPYSATIVGNTYGFFHRGEDNFDLTPTHITIGSPVPEPETYAMMLAGLGLLGFAARRRKQKEAAQA